MMIDVASVRARVKGANRQPMETEKQTMLEDLAAIVPILPAYLPTDDPRPELEADSTYWGRLLSLAHGNCDEADPACLFWVLNGLRCMGCGLAYANGEWRIVAGENQDYQRDREYLRPHTELLRQILGKLSGV